MVRVLGGGGLSEKKILVVVADREQRLLVRSQKGRKRIGWRIENFHDGGDLLLQGDGVALVLFGDLRQVVDGSFVEQGEDLSGCRGGNAIEFVLDGRI